MRGAGHQPGLTPAEKHALAQLLPQENQPASAPQLKSLEPADNEKTAAGQDFYSYVNSDWLALTRCRRTSCRSALPKS
jgi:hypothetical protein